MYAQVILPINIDSTFTYGVPIEMQPTIAVGMRVEVAFGKKNIYTGIVESISNTKPEEFSIKPIISCLDPEPVITPEQLDLWRWISSYYLCSMGDVMNASLPSFLKLSSQTIIGAIPEMEIDEYPLSNRAILLLERLKLNEEMSVKEIEKIFQKETQKILKELFQYQLIYSYTERKDKYLPKQEPIIVLNDDYDHEEALKELFDTLERAPKQMQLLLAYLQLCEQSTYVSQKELLSRADASAAQLKAMIDKKIFSKSHRIVSRLKIKPAKYYEPFTLSEAQQEALSKIQTHLATSPVTLLHGVTGSGKTNVIIKTIESYLDQGKQVLYLLPEIALTVQIINKLYSEFGDLVHVYHSKYSNHERVETWQLVQSGKPLLLVGARSAVLLPFTQLGLIVVDEEHEANYKQAEPAPRYHARDVAIYMGHKMQIPVLLSSATPSLETVYNVQKKKYQYVALTKRYGDASLPRVEIVSHRIELAEDYISKILSNELIHAMKQVLAQKNQVLLFQNRRGYAPYLYCGECGWQALCNSCDTSLIYHKQIDKLMCHYCNARQSVIKLCKRCHSSKLYYKNYGTERIEEELNRLFPQNIIDRMDTDTIRTRNKYQNLIEQVEKKHIQILVGTQMIAKGLDFDHVHLVGILSADSLLTNSNFRASERAFQLITQVSGRAGRKGKDALVIIQALNTQHPIYEYIIKNDFKGYVKVLLQERLAFRYPPYSRLVKITLRHLKETKVQEVSSLFAQSLSQIKEIEVLGPAKPVISKIKNYYLRTIIVKIPLSGVSIQNVKNVIRDLAKKYQQQTGNSGLGIILDVDPQ